MDEKNAGRAQDELRWIESSGGPFVVLPASYCSSWLGSDGADYDAACEVDSYLGLVCFDDPERVGLVVADEPLRTTFLPDLQCLLQWQYAWSESALVSAARRSIEGPLHWELGPLVEFRERVVIFDAAASGDSVDASELLELPVVPGIYECFTADYSVGDDVSGRLHQFRPAGDDRPGGGPAVR